MTDTGVVLIDWETHQLQTNTETSSSIPMAGHTFRGCLSRHGELQRSRGTQILFIGVSAISIGTTFFIQSRLLLQ